MHGGHVGDRIDILSDRQKDCLRLVGRGMSSKEIAIETGLSPNSVDTYLKAAMSSLGVANRRDAARLLGSHEASQHLGSPTPAVAAVLARPQSGATIVGGGAGMLSLPLLGGRPNHLSAAAKTFAVLRIAAVSAVVVVAIALLIVALFRTFR